MRAKYTVLLPGPPESSAAASPVAPAPQAGPAASGEAPL